MRQLRATGCNLSLQYSLLPICPDRTPVWTWTGDVGQRTEFHLPLSFTVSTEQTFLHQTISSKAVRLQRLGWSYSKIARELGVTDKTAKKAAVRAIKSRYPS